jgi:hypothetical protein
MIKSPQLILYKSPQFRNKKHLDPRLREDDDCKIVKSLGHTIIKVKIA